MTDKQQRLPRFTRDLEAAGSFQFTQRDLEILRHVAEHRLIKSEWLVKLVGGSKQQVLRRLHLLYHHGYLDRPRAQLDYFHKGGSKSLVYGLASRGAGRLRRDLDMPFERMDWTTRNKAVGRLFLEHTLMVSDYMAALELDCRDRPNVRLLYAHELPHPQGCGNSREPFRWTVDLPGRRRVEVIPDKVFAIETEHSHGQIQRMHYFLEADRGTMPLKRRDLSLSSLNRKLIAYRSLVPQLRAKGLRGNLPAYLVIITTSHQRANGLAELSTVNIKKAGQHKVPQSALHSLKKLGPDAVSLAIAIQLMKSR